MRKMLSLMLSLAIIVSLFSGMDITAQAENTHEHLNRYDVDTTVIDDKANNTSYVYDPVSGVASYEPSNSYENFLYEIKSGEVTIIGYYGYSVNITVPSEIDGYPVTVIGERAFVNKTDIRTVTLPEGLVEIGDWAFYQCSSLSEVTLPESLLRIGEVAFRSCDIREINIPDGVTIIESEAFMNCSSLTSVKLPSTLKAVGNEAFCGCSGLSEIEIPKSVEKIGEYAFGFTNLRKVVLPDNLSVIEDSAFYGCDRMEEAVLSDSIITIGDYAFAYCSKLKKINIPNSVTSIGNSAFFNCPFIKEVILPDNLMYIGNGAFRNCKLLESIVISPENKFYTTIDGVLYNKDVTVLLSYPYAKPDSLFKVPYGVECIDEYAFTEFVHLAAIYIPKTVTELNYQDFVVAGFHTLYEGTRSQAIDAFGKDNYWLKYLYWDYSCTDIPDTITPYLSVDFTCTEIGYKLYNCPVCESTIIASVTEAHHNIITIEAKKPTHEEDGNIEYYKCTECGMLFRHKDSTLEQLLPYETVIPSKKDHEGEYDHDENSHWIVCYYCDEHVDIDEHVYEHNIWTVVKEPTIDSPGLKTRECLVCGYVEERAIPFGIIGDINFDGKVDGIDSVLILQILANWDIRSNDINLDMADIDGDGSITGMDAVLMLQYLAGWYDEFPA